MGLNTPVVSDGPESELNKDFETLTEALCNLTKDVGERIAIDVERLKIGQEDHAVKLNQLNEELSRMNRNLEKVQDAMRRIVNKLNEQGGSLDVLEKKLAAKVVQAAKTADTSSEIEKMMRKHVYGNSKKGSLFDFLFSKRK